jgi:alkylhydroperoxidase family enzyme
MSDAVDATGGVAPRPSPHDSASRVERLRKIVIERALHGAGETTGDARRAAFDNREVPAAAGALIDKVANHAWQVTDDDVDAARRAGLSEDEIFELVVCAALGQATRQLDAALAAVEAATDGAKR